MCSIGSGVRMPATTSSPCALTRNSPYSRALARRRVAREADPRAGGVALVAEHHLDDVHGGAEVVRDVVRAPVDTRARRLPRVEDGAGRASKLLARVGGERRRRPRARRAPGTSRSGRAGRRPSARRRVATPRASLSACSSPSKTCPSIAVDDLAVHLDQAAVRVEREPWVAGRGREPLDRDVVQAEVEDRVHHPGHRDRGAGADGDEQRVGRVPEALPGLLLEPRDVVVDLRARAPPAPRRRSWWRGTHPS